MIPSVAVFRYQNPRNRRFRLWIPLFLLWIPVLLLAPVLLLVLCAVSLVARANAFRIIGGILCALSGTRVDVQARGNAVTVKII